MLDMLVKVLMEMVEFLPRIRMCLMNYLWVRLPNLAHLGKTLVSSNVEVDAMKWGDC